MNNWNRVAFPSQNGFVDLPMKKSGSRRRIPLDKIRQDAMASSEGGRAHCDYCGNSFSANYVDPVYAGFVQKFACRDCRKKNGLQRA